MKHERQQIREAIVALLLGRTDAGPRVYPGEWTPQQRSLLPAISVSIQAETPRPDSFDREPREYFVLADVQIAVWHIRTAEADDIDDLVDTLCRQIECQVERQPTLCLACVEDLRYDGTQLVYDERGERQMGAALLQYQVTYARPAFEVVNADTADDLDTMSAEFNLDGNQDPADRTSIIFPAAGEIEFFGTTPPPEVRQFARGTVTAAPTRFDIQDARDEWTQFAPAVYAYARSDAFSHASQFGVSVPPPSINLCLRAQAIHNSPAQWPRTGLTSIPATEINNLFGNAILGKIFVDVPPGEYTQLVTGLVPGAPYVFSVWLIADTAGNDAELQMRDGVGGPVLATSGVFPVTEDILTRHFITTNAPASGEIEVAIRYLEFSINYRFPDAAQLEPGTTPTEFIPQIGGGPDVPIERGQTTVTFELHGQTGTLTNTGNGPEVTAGFEIAESDGNTVAKLRQT